LSAPVDRFLAQLAARLDLPAAERDQVVAELKSHLMETISARLEATPSRVPDEVAREAVAELGDPTVLALAYAPDGRVELRDAEERTVHRFSAAVTRAGRAVEQGARSLGRGTGRVVRGTALVAVIAVALILVSSTVLTVVLFDDVSAWVRGAQSELVHHTSDHCDPAACRSSAPAAKSFHVHPEARHVRFNLDLHAISAGNGTATVRVLNPDGVPMYERTFESGEEAHYRDFLVWKPYAGTWRVETQYDGFAGELRLRVYVLGSPA
jgi:hypothetical protein